MDVTRDETEKYLSEIVSCIRSGKYQISVREKNLTVFRKYLFTEEDAKTVIYSLTVDDFSEAVPNDHVNHADEIIYIFGKNVTLLPRMGGDEVIVPLYIKFNKLGNQYVFIISFHEQEYPLSYKFK